MVMGFRRWAWSLGVALVGGGCALLPTAQLPQTEADSTVKASASSADLAAPDPGPPAARSPQAPSDSDSESVVKSLQPDAQSRGMGTYQAALNKAYGAAKLTQSAQVPSDWEFVASRWQEAMDLLATIPAGHSTHGQARQKLEEYGQNRRYALQRSRLPAPPPPPSVALRPAPPPAAAAPAPEEASPTGDPNGEASGNGEPPAPLPGGDPTLLASAPIVNRLGGIPVIGVELNGREFSMAIDTGASLTVLTPAMAAALQLQPTGTIRVNTPSDTAVELPISQVQRLRVGNVIASNLQVAVSPSMTIGLLGQNFFGNYDVTIRGDRVEFHRR